MVIGIIPDASTAEILLNNLSEAEFNLKDVSVIMRDVKQRNAISKDQGPLKGASYDQVAARLAQAGLNMDEARQYQDAVAQGKVLVVMQTTPDTTAAAAEMFTDQSGEMVKEINNGEPKKG